MKSNLAAVILAAGLSSRMGAFTRSVRNPTGLVYPCFQGQIGRPPLISIDLREIILKSEDQGRLHRVLAECPDRTIAVEVGEEGILWDMDEWADYQRLLGKVDI